KIARRGTAPPLRGPQEHRRAERPGPLPQGAGRGGVGRWCPSRRASPAGAETERTGKPQVNPSWRSSGWVWAVRATRSAADPENDLYPHVSLRFPLRLTGKCAVARGGRGVVGGDRGGGSGGGW